MSNDLVEVAVPSEAGSSEAVPSEVPSKVNLLGMTAARLATFFQEMGEKPFRAKQVLKWIHHHGVTDFEQMTDLGKALRARLNASAEVRAPEIVSQDDSADGTRKWVLQVSTGNCVEAVYIPEKGRGTLCVSSQVGCSVDCSFCSTGKQGFMRDLTAAEIIGQVWLAERSFGAFEVADQTQRERRVTNVVMMGMGEPLLNFDNVVDAMGLMMDDNAYGLSKRRVTLSTSGIVPMLEKLGEHSDCSLAISLHAPNNELRSQLVPVNRKYPIEQLLDASLRYINGLSDNKRVITIEYTLIDRVNDSLELAHELVALLKDVPCKINLIPFNPFPGSDYKRPSNNRVKAFQKVLNQAGFIAPVRTTRGDDIDAACGQLVGQVQDRTRRSERYRNAQSSSEGGDIPSITLH